MDFNASAKVVQLDCLCQSNTWGKRGSNSEVARLLKSRDPIFEVDEEAHYAELWMGTHRKWPSYVHGTSQTLENWLLDHPECLGDDITSRFDHGLPFMMKVLSIEKTLTLQAHPGKELAERLYASDPVNYLDSNHKPELCVALTPFRAMCGFRPIKEVARFITDIPELTRVVGERNADKLLLANIPEFARVVGERNADKLLLASETDDVALHELAMKNCFAGLLRQDKATMQAELRKLVNKARALVISGVNARHYEAALLLKLYREYPDDVGCFSVYFLNVHSLQPGEALYVDTGVIHAYIEGECIECLSCSDNIVRGGLSAKHRDVDTLVDMLDYTCPPADQYMLAGHWIDAESGCRIQRYDPPVQDFSVLRIQVPVSARTATLSAMASGSIVICTQGRGSLSSRSLAESVAMRRGVVLFIAANEECSIKAEDEMLLFRACVGR